MMRYLHLPRAPFKYWHISFVNLFFCRIATGLLAAGTVVFAQLAYGAEVWVSPSGKDSNPGTAAQPFATLARAQQKARDLHEVARTYDYQPIHIILHGGTYSITKPIVLKPEDSGDRNNFVTISAAPGETPVLSGGIEIHGWKPAAAAAGLPGSSAGKVWVAEVPRIDGRVLEFRQLWVDGSKAIRARETVRWCP